MISSSNSIALSILLQEPSLPSKPLFQPLFTQMIEGLRKQGFNRSVTDSTTFAACQYRGMNGARCAVGWCIPDALYGEDLEGLTVPMLATTLAISAFGTASDDMILFLMACQFAHDNSRNPSDMIRRFADLAEIFNLEFPA